MTRLSRRAACLTTSLIFLLGGCATEALNSAPDRPDAPCSQMSPPQGNYAPANPNTV